MFAACVLLMHVEMAPIMAIIEGGRVLARHIKDAVQTAATKCKGPFVNIAGTVCSKAPKWVSF